ncbi:hypothetical protein EMIT0324P_80091 [Pseudomonas chlororaphis]
MSQYFASLSGDTLRFESLTT